MRGSVLLLERLLFLICGLRLHREVVALVRIIECDLLRLHRDLQLFNDELHMLLFFLLSVAKHRFGS